jgi:hypothetical protein
MSRWGLRGAVALIAAATMAVTATPALADIKWVTAECFSGAVETTLVQGINLGLEGRVDCADTGEGARFGIARYAEGVEYADMYQATLRPYAATAPTAFSVANDTHAGPGSFALCVVTDVFVRVACVKVVRHLPASTTQTGSPMVVTPLSTDDPYVRKQGVKIIEGGTDSGSSPACGHCW